MAFKRRTKFRTPFRRSKGRVTRALVNTKARKHYNWVEVLDTTCNVIQLFPNICVENEELSQSFPTPVDCTTGVVALDPAAPLRISLLEPNLESLGGAGNAAAYLTDDVTIVRMIGGIRFMPYWVLTEESLAVINSFPVATREAIKFQFLAERHYMMRAGMVKQAAQYDPLNDDYIVPVRDPWQSPEWVDGRFMRMWTFEKMAGELGQNAVDIRSVGSPVGVCSDVTGTGGGGGSSAAVNGLTWAATEGAINTSVTDIDVSTECTLITATEAFSTKLVTLLPTRSFYLNLASRKRIRCRENEALSVWLNWATANYSDLAAPNCAPITHGLGVGFLARAHVKMLVEN